MKKTNKKGFTIVELVIVIAVIAILAAVLVPNISRLVKKANQSADESLVRNLNTALAMDTEKHTTMTAALNAAYENGGYDVAKIVTKNSDAKILWDSVNDCFVYLNGSDKVYLPNTQTEKKVDDWQYFEICNEMPSKQQYSIYANWTAAAGETVADLTVGFDAGKNVFESLTFKTNETRTVIINTNGGALTVEADNATVNHYGEADSVKIVAVAPASYHENGKVIGNIEIIKGRIEVAAKAEVGTIFVSSAAANDVKVDVASGAKLGAVAPTTDAAVTDVKASTSIPADAKLTEKTSINTDFAGGLGTENSPYLIATAEQFLNIKKYSEQMKTAPYCFALLNNIDLTTVNVGSYVANTFNGVLNGNNYSILVNPSQSYMFKYAVNDVVIENLSYTLNGTKAMVFFNRYATTASKYDSSTEKYTAVRDVVNLTFRNLTIEGQPSTFHQFELHNYGLLTSCQSYLEILNAKVIGGKPDANKDSYYAYTSETKNCSTNTVIENCVVNANLSGTPNKYNAVLLGGQTESKNHVKINEVTYNGIFIGYQIGVVFANSHGSLSDPTMFDIKNVRLTGSLICTPADNAMAGISFANDTYEFDGSANQGTISTLTVDATMNISLNDSRYTLVAATDAKVTKYYATIKLPALKFTDSTYTADLGEASTNSLTIEVVPGELEIYKSKVMTKQQAESKGISLTTDWKLSTDGLHYQFVNSDGQWYLVIDYSASGMYCEFKNTEVDCTVVVYAYDQSNQLLHVTEGK